MVKYCQLSTTRHIGVRGGCLFMGRSFSNQEMQILSIIWREGGRLSAKDIHAEMEERFGYTRGATYALIHRLIEKGAIERIQPGFVCHALVGAEEVGAVEARWLADTVFGGSAERLLAALVSEGSLSSDEIARLRDYIDSLETDEGRAR